MFATDDIIPTERLDFRIDFSYIYLLISVS